MLLQMDQKPLIDTAVEAVASGASSNLFSRFSWIANASMNSLQETEWLQEWIACLPSLVLKQLSYQLNYKS